MAPRTQSAGDENDAAAVLVEPSTVPAPTPEAAETGGEKWIRTLYRADHFQVDEKRFVNGVPQKFTSGIAKEIIELAARNGVKIAVADVEKG